jgi:hypothetical protein
VVQDDLQGRSILESMLGIAGARDRSHVVPGQDPGQGDPGRRCVVPRGDIAQRRVTENPSLLDGRVRRDRDVELAADREQVELRARRLRS